MGFGGLDFGDKIRYIRETRGLSTTEVATLSGLSQSFISDIENKRRQSPTIKTVQKLAKALGTSVSYLVDEDIVTPFEVFGDLPADLRELMLSDEVLPYMKIIKTLKDERIPPLIAEKLYKDYLDLRKMINKKNNNVKTCRKNYPVSDRFFY